MNDTSLLVIDMQAGNFQLPSPIAFGEELVQTVSILIEKARSVNVPVIYIQNDGPEGSVDEPGTPGWEIHPAVAPSADEPVLRKRTPDSFLDTGLAEELSELGIRRLVICGLQTEFCVDTTVRRAVSLGYEVMLVSDGHSTWDSPVLNARQIIDHHNNVLGSAFATVYPAYAVLF